jgi:hypothetical protein
LVHHVCHSPRNMGDRFGDSHLFMASISSINAMRFFSSFSCCVLLLPLFFDLNNSEMAWSIRSSRLAIDDDDVVVVDVSAAFLLLLLFTESSNKRLFLLVVAVVVHVREKPFTPWGCLVNSRIGTTTTRTTNILNFAVVFKSRAKGRRVFLMMLLVMVVSVVVLRYSNAVLLLLLYYSLELPVIAEVWFCCPSKQNMIRYSHVDVKIRIRVLSETYKNLSRPLWYSVCADRTDQR